MEKMTNVESRVVEKILKPKAGIPVLILQLLLLIVDVLGVIFLTAIGLPFFILLGVIILIAICISFAGLKVVNPNEALVLTLFGKYYGTIVDDGFFFVNPFVSAFNPTAKGLEYTLASATKKKKGEDDLEVAIVSKKVSTKIQTLNNNSQKVNDNQGNPVVIGSVVIWKVAEPTMAVFNVENYFQYLSIQCDAIIRNTARMYPYDNFDSEDDEMTLRGSSLEIADMLKDNLQEKVRNAGIEILEVKITHLSYAEEIAAAMLKRQQASATIAAREKIVEGAVGMVQMALEKMEQDNVVTLDDEKKAAMVSNLLVVLCGEQEAKPVINSGSIY